MAEVLKEPIGTEGELVVTVSAGKIKMTAVHNHESGSASVTLEQDAGYFLDKLKAVIPGVFDDAIIELAKTVLKQMP